MKKTPIEGNNHHTINWIANNQNIEKAKSNNNVLKNKQKFSALKIWVQAVSMSYRGKWLIHLFLWEQAFLIRSRFRTTLRSSNTHQLKSLPKYSITWKGLYHCLGRNINSNTGPSKSLILTSCMTGTVISVIIKTSLVEANAIAVITKKIPIAGSTMETKL